MNVDDILTDEESLDLIEQWLVSLHATMWQSWDLTQPDSRRTAATWLFKTLNDLLDYIEDHDIEIVSPV